MPDTISCTYATNPTLLFDQWSLGVPEHAGLGYAQQIFMNYEGASYWGLGGYANLIAVNMRGAQAIIGVSRSSLVPGATSGMARNDFETAGGYFIGENDIQGSPASFAVYGVYGEARGSNSEFAANELDCQNTSGADCRVLSPNAIFGTDNTKMLGACAWLSLGGSKAPYGAWDVPAAIVITAEASTNGSRFKGGIIVDRGAVREIDGHAGAVQLPDSDEVQWHAADGTVGRLTSDGTNLFWNGQQIHGGSANMRRRTKAGLAAGLVALAASIPLSFVVAQQAAQPPQQTLSIEQRVGALVGPIIVGASICANNLEAANQEKAALQKALAEANAKIAELEGGKQK